MKKYKYRVFCKNAQGVIAYCSSLKECKQAVYYYFENFGYNSFSVIDNKTNQTIKEYLIYENN